MPGETHLSPKLPHVQYRLSLKLDSVFTCLRQSLGSVGKYLRFLNRSNGQSFETDLLSEIKAFLNGWGIHQR